MSKPNKNNSPNNKYYPSYKNPGNPRASEVMAKVNKPKIDNAINFALIFKPVIATFEQDDLSQRKMLEKLNDNSNGNNFTPPQGGKWVLSQLQKVINRIKLNDAALNLETKFIEYAEQNLSNQTITDKLNSLGEYCPIGNQWTAEIVEKVKERIYQIHDIINFNQFIIDMLPIIKENQGIVNAKIFYQAVKDSPLDFPYETVKAATPTIGQEPQILWKLVKMRCLAQKSARAAISRLAEYEIMQKSLKQKSRLKPVHEKIFQQHIILAEASNLIFKDNPQPKSEKKMG